MALDMGFPALIGVWGVETLCAWGVSPKSGSMDSHSNISADILSIISLSTRTSASSSPSFSFRANSLRGLFP
ncbi:hypothetical protein HOY80DRAFT_993501 [Tuber brumale]|nr:hypothetical protein HOY80DRAFT_993501 [Tuber brumale]